MREPKLYEYRGKEYTAAQLAELAGVSMPCMSSRLEAGWSIEDAVEKPVRHNRIKYKYKGEMLSPGQLAKIHGGISARAMRDRLERGMPVEEALAKPVRRYARKTPAAPQKPEKRTERFEPHRSAADMAKCKKCRYSEKDGINAVCMFLVLHDPRERRGCEPGKNCKRFAPLSNKMRAKKIASWVGGQKR